MKLTPNLIFGSCVRPVSTILIIALAIIAAPIKAQHSNQLNIIPAPVKQVVIKGKFNITPNTAIVLTSNQSENSAAFFNNYLKTIYGFELKIAKRKTEGNNAVIFDGSLPGKSIPGSYELNVGENKVRIQGGEEQGMFYGMQTLLQLLPVKKSKSLAIQHCRISDAPRFAYRGMHLDIGRHFFTVDFIKKYIDYMALHKMNYFHWHLTEDQGWRIEIKKYPKLTDIGAWRNGTMIGRYADEGNDNIRYGGYYTQEQIRDIVAYAQQRYITIVPEIEMPGHSSAAIAAYPELSCFPEESSKTFPVIPAGPRRDSSQPSKEKAEYAWNGDSSGKHVQQAWGVYEDVYCAGKENTFSFLEDVLDEVMALFPSKMIHVGGDECPKLNWKRCSNCQKRIGENGLKNEHELQSYFIKRIEKYLNNKGRVLVGWDEILEGGLAPNATVMSWRGEKGGIAAAKQHHRAIMTPTDYLYFNYSQTIKEDSLAPVGFYLPVETVYKYEPIPAQLSRQEQKYIIGLQANLWTEFITNPANVEYMIFPRAAAASEIAWSQKERKNWSDFKRRLQTQTKRYDLWSAAYNKHGIDKGDY